MSTTQQATGLRESEKRILSAFPTKRYRCATPATAPTCAALVKRGLMESDICGDVVVYRTNAAGKAALKAGGVE